MSVHYDFALACDLKPDTPQQVLATLAYLTRTADYAFHDPPSNPLFEVQDINGERGGLEDHAARAREPLPW